MRKELNNTIQSRSDLESGSIEVNVGPKTILMFIYCKKVKNVKEVSLFWTELEGKGGFEKRLLDSQNKNKKRAGNNLDK
eukprot:TRINITY_DN3174_c1_g1_i24.p1 TRINITY_DN3174_c1_g1~~TRINITY_DN3174_c1_g1_i24.p1  ORF type:complete len:79 (+),score=13.19 TRINITY_DN3174_c1_g1_i24:82-318(+)